MGLLYFVKISVICTPKMVAGHDLWLRQIQNQSIYLYKVPKVRKEWIFIDAPYGLQSVLQKHLIVLYVFRT